MIVRLAVVFSPSGIVHWYFHSEALLVAVKTLEARPLSAKTGGRPIASSKLAVNSIFSPPLKKLESLFHSRTTLGGVVSWIKSALAVPLMALPAVSMALSILM